MEKYKIRKATNKDLKDISRIFREGTIKKPYNKKWNEKETDKIIKKLFKDNDINVAIVDNRIIGFIVSHIRDNKKSSHVGELWLEPKYQGKDIGKALMKLVENKYKKRNVNELDLFVNQKAKAVGFYKKLGYKEKYAFFQMTKKLK